MREQLIAILCVLASWTGIAFAAFCIWLTVRIVNRRERWAKRLAAALVALMLGYVLSFGPMARLEARRDLPKSLEPAFEAVYLPFGLGVNFGPQWMRSAIIWYLQVWDAW